jgi:glycerol-3-phosphate acyltransferase PlsY
MMNTDFSLSPVIFLFIPITFLLGSIPFGIIFTRKSGVDIRQKGSRNIGATNVLRHAGNVPAILTLLGDFAKGAIPVLLCGYIFSDADPATDQFLKAAIGLTAVLGHMFSVFLLFRGGKGVATGFGVLAIYAPLNAAVTLVIWIAVVAITRHVSLGAIISVGMLPLIFIVQKASTVSIAFGVSLAVLIIVKHRSNIRNLIAGTEAKLGEKDDQKY